MSQRRKRRINNEEKFGVSGVRSELAVVCGVKHQTLSACGSWRCVQVGATGHLLYIGMDVWHSALLRHMAFWQRAGLQLAWPCHGCEVHSAYGGLIGNGQWSHLGRGRAPFVVGWLSGLEGECPSSPKGNWRQRKRVSAVLHFRRASGLPGCE